MESIFTRFTFIAAAGLVSAFAFAQDQVAPQNAPVKGNLFNPNINVNFMGLLQYGSALSTTRAPDGHEGVSLQEVELQFNSAVDPYLRASALLSIGQEDGQWGIEPEEVFLETTSLPVLSLRAGKFKMAMGKHNLLHAHAYPFIDAPLINEQLLGDEGLNEAGLSAAILAPLPWFSEVTLEIFDGSNELLYNSSTSGNLATLAHLKNLVELNDSFTAELGLSGTWGKNAFNETAQAYGADLTFKWRGSKARALTWSTEYLFGNRMGLADETTGNDIARVGGLSTSLQSQIAKRWWLQGRYERTGLPHPAEIDSQTKISALVGFFPSEFSGIRMQYSWLKTASVDSNQHYVGLQYNVSIGAHPAHVY